MLQATSTHLTWRRALTRPKKVSRAVRGLQTQTSQNGYQGCVIRIYYCTSVQSALGNIGRVLPTSISVQEKKLIGIGNKQAIRSESERRENSKSYDCNGIRKFIPVFQI